MAAQTRPPPPCPSPPAMLRPPGEPAVQKSGGLSKDANEENRRNAFPTACLSAAAVWLMDVTWFAPGDQRNPTGQLQVYSPFPVPQPCRQRSEIARQSFQVQQQAVSDVVMRLQQQLLERDRTIAELRSQLAALQEAQRTT